MRRAGRNSRTIYTPTQYKSHISKHLNPGVHVSAVSTGIGINIASYVASTHSGLRVSFIQGRHNSLSAHRMPIQGSH